MSLKKIGRLKPAEFSYKNPTHGNTEKLTMGIMAQDIDKIWPHEKYSITQKDQQGNYLVDYYQLLAPIIKSIQELSDKIEIIENKLKEEN